MYPADPHYHELDDEARVWRIYLDEAQNFDRDVVVEARESLDVLLVFVSPFDITPCTLSNTRRLLRQVYSLLFSRHFWFRRRSHYHRNPMLCRPVRC